MRGFRDTSGLCAVANHPEASKQVWLGLQAVQHRGDAGVMMAVSDGDHMRTIRGRGTVEEGLERSHVEGTRGAWAVGQVYGCVELDPNGDNPAPLIVGQNRGGDFAVALSGRFSNGAELRKSLQQQGSMLCTNSDAELLALLISRSDRNTPVNRIVDALWRVEGGYVAVVMSKDRLVAVRDPRGFRPLVLGRVDEGWVIASEEGAIRAMGGWVEQVIEPGEMVILDRKGRRVVRPFPKRATSACIHELVSVARPDTRLFGQDVHQMRVALGVQLAKESGGPKDGVVVGLPDGSQAAAVGYARESSLPYEPGLMLTDEGIWLAVPGVVRERKVVLVAGHLATGNAVRRGVQLLREAGAKEVHVRVSSPAARVPCPYGLSSPMRDELAMGRHEDQAKLATRMGSDDVRCLSHDALLAVAGEAGEEASPFCSMCFGGRAPLAVEEMDDQLPLF